VVNTLSEIARKHDCAIIVVHHTRKEAGEGLDTLMGTTGISAAADAVWILKKRDGASVLTVTGRELQEESFGLQFDSDDLAFGWRITARGDEVGLSEQRAEILELLRNEGTPMKPAKVSQLLKKNANTTRRLLTMMHRDGHVEKSASGGYTTQEEPR
jgi:RecA-family ATPase